MDVLYVTCEMWMTCRHMYENYVDSYGKLLEDQEGDSNTGNLTN